MLLAAAVVWLSAGRVIGTMLERDFRDAGFRNPDVIGARLAPGGVAIRRVRLAANDLVLEGVKAEVGTSGVVRLAIDTLRLRAALEANGRLALPDGLGEPGSGSGAAPLELVPRDGLAIGSVEIMLSTAAGPSTLLLSALQVQRRDDAAHAEAQYSLEHAAGRLQGTASATLTSAGSLDFALAARGAVVADAVIEGRAVLGPGLRSLEASGRAQLDRDDAQGELAIDVRLDGQDAGRELSGRVQITGRKLALPSLFRDASFALSADVDANPERVSLTSSNEWAAELTPIAGLLPESMHALADEPLTMTFAPRAGQALDLIVTFDDRRARLDAELTAHAADAQLRAAGALAARWATPITLSAEQLQIDAAELPWDTLLLGIDGFEGAASYEHGEWQLSGAGSLVGRGAAGPARFAGLTARWSGSITGSPAAVAVTADRCVEWQLAALEWSDVRAASVSPPCIAPHGDAALAVYRPDIGSLTLAFAAPAAALDLALSRAGEAVAVEGTWPSLTLAGTLDARGVTSLEAAFDEGSLVLPDERIAIDGVQGSLTMADGALSTVMLAAAAIESRAEPALWTPLELEASARGEGSGLDFDALLSDALGIVVLEATGRSEQGSGAAHLTLHPLQFLSGATEIDDVSPALAEHVTDASGSIAFAGTLEWDADGTRSFGELVLTGAGATVSSVAITGIDTTTTLSSLLPPATPPEQTLHIAALDLGVPLEDGVAVYELEADGRIAVGELTFDLAGGRLSTEPFTIDSGDFSDIRFVLEADGVDLSQLLALSQIEGLEGTGALSGRVPVRVSARGIELDDGVLAAETDGTLRYTPEDLPEFLRGDDVRSRMLREALTNFQYDELAITIAADSEGSDEQLVSLSAKGANPDFLEGHPIELNFNFRGPLLGAMRSAVDLSSAEAVQQLFEQQDESESALESTP